MNLLQKYAFRIIKQPLRAFSQEISLFLMIFSLCCYVGVNGVEEKGGRQLPPKDRNGKAPERAGVSCCSGTSSL